MSAKIACVIPSYNHARYVQEAIESVLRQSLPPDRLIIIDDGSSDESVKRIRTFNDQKIQLIEQENQGAHAALNRGLALANKSDFIAILNSDDRYHQARFAKCVAYLERHSDIQLVCTQVRIIDERVCRWAPKMENNGALIESGRNSGKLEILFRPSAKEIS